MLPYRPPLGMRYVHVSCSCSCTCTFTVLHVSFFPANLAPAPSAIHPAPCRTLCPAPQYTVPPGVKECLAAAADPAAQASCLAVEGNWFNAVVALDMDTGELAWGRRMSYLDVWVNGLRVVGKAWCGLRLVGKAWCGFAACITWACGLTWGGGQGLLWGRRVHKLGVWINLDWGGGHGLLWGHGHGHGGAGVGSARVIPCLDMWVMGVG